jgi:hypothetical protein
MDEQHANYVAANPAIGGDPRTLNQPSIQDRQCAGVCTWQRTVTSVLPGPVAYQVQASAPPGLAISVEPAQFTLAAGASQTLTVRIVVGSAALGPWHFGEIAVQPQVPGVSTMRLPVAVVATASDLIFGNGFQ